MHMKIDSLRPIVVSRNLDNLVDEILIDCSMWCKVYPELTKYRVEIKSPAGITYISTSTKFDNNVLCWTIEDSDTGVVGEGEYQVVATGENGERKTSVPNILKIQRIISDTMSETPPDPSKPWVDKVIEAADRAEEAANRAENAASSGGGGGGSGIPREDGGFYIPSVDDEGNLSWSSSKEDMPEVTTVNIKGEDGDSGVYVGEEKPIDPNVKVWVNTGGNPSPVVKYTAQALNKNQQEQARLNIDAASTESVQHLSEEIVDLNKAAVKSINGKKPDQNGNVQVEGGGSEGEYELIEEFTLEEDVSTITRDRTPSGETYNFKKILLFIDTPAIPGYSNSNPVYFVCHGNKALYSNVIVRMHKLADANYTSFASILLQSCNGRLFGDGKISANNVYNQNSIHDTGAASQIGRIARNAFDGVTLWGLTDKFYTGTKIRIWGVRA